MWQTRGWKERERETHAHKQFTNSTWSLFHTCDKQCEKHTDTVTHSPTSRALLIPLKISMSGTVLIPVSETEPILLPFLISVIVNVSLFWVHQPYPTRLVTVAQARVTIPIVSQCDSSDSKWDNFDTSITYRSGVPLPTECEWHFEC